MRIITDNKWKNFLYGDEVPKKVLDDYDWLDGEAKQDGWIKYKGEYYHISDFIYTVRIPEPKLKSWDAYKSDSYFSGIVIKLSPDIQQYKIGLYLT